jgi:tight adherence protein C
VNLPPPELALIGIALVGVILVASSLPKARGSARPPGPQDSIDRASIDRLLGAFDTSSRAGFESLSREVLAEPAPRPEGLRLRLARAGLHDEGSYVVLVVAQLLLATGLPAIVMALDPVVSPQMQPALAIALGIVGWLIPSFHLSYRVNRRATEMRHHAPMMMDLLVTSAEAGLGLDAALQLTAQHTYAFCPALGIELARVNDQVSAGVPRAQALEALVERTDLDETRTLVMIVGQNVRMNTGIGDALRAYAESAREKRMLEGEQVAKRAATVIGLTAAITMLPPFLLILIVPKLIEAWRQYEQV